MDEVSANMDYRVLQVRINPAKSTQLIWGMQTTSPVWAVMWTSFKDDSLRVSFSAFPTMGDWISNRTIW